MLVHCRVTPSIEFASIHLYTWVERGTVKIKCLSQEHNTMSLARAQIQPDQSRCKCTNHKATTHLKVYTTLISRVIVFARCLT